MIAAFTRNHFELLGLAPSFALDHSVLESRYRDLQGRVHPDRFAAAPAAEQRLALQWAARANEAYKTLRDPVDRARYLLSLKGFDTGEETNTAMPADFLMQQMEWREGVAEASAAHDAGKLGHLRGAIGEERSEMLRQLERAIDRDSNFDAGCSLVRKLRFLEKLESEIDEALQ